MSDFQYKEKGHFLSLMSPLLAILDSPQKTVLFEDIRSENTGWSNQLNNAVFRAQLYTWIAFFGIQAKIRLHYVRTFYLL